MGETSDQDRHFLLRQESYWPLRPERYFRDDATFNRACLDLFMMRLEPGARVLDLACGVGIETRRLEERGLKVYPLDGNPEFMQLIKNGFPEFLASPLGRKLYVIATQSGVISKVFTKLNLGLEAAQRRVVADVLRLPFQESVFDGVLCKHLLAFGDDEERLAILGQIFTSLKSGGKGKVSNSKVGVGSPARVPAGLGLNFSVPGPVPPPRRLAFRTQI